MNRFVLLGVFLMLMVVVGFFGMKYLTKPKPPPPPTTASIVVARVDIFPRTVVTKDMLNVETRKIAELPKDYQTSLVGGRERDNIVGVVAKNRIYAGEMVPRASLSTKLQQLGIAWIIPPFHRAMVLDMKVEPNFHDVLKHGDRVDVIGTFDNEYTRTLVENVEVLGVDFKIGGQHWETRGPWSPEGQRAYQQQVEAAREAKKAEPPPPEPNINLVLAVKPQDAEIIALAYSSATIDYVLRPKPDELASPESGVLAPDLSGLPEMAAPAPQPAPTAEGGKAQTRIRRQKTAGVSLASIVPNIYRQSGEDRESETVESSPPPSPAPPTVSSPRPRREAPAHLAVGSAPASLPPMPVTETRSYAPTTAPEGTPGDGAEKETTAAGPSHRVELITKSGRQTIEVPQPAR